MFRSLLNESSNSIFLISLPSGQFIDVNSNACRKLGFSRDELLDRSVVDIEVSLPSQSAWQEHVEEIRSEESRTYTGRHRRKDGSTFPVEVDVDYITEDGHEYLLAIARDISDRDGQLRDIERKQTRASVFFEEIPIAMSEVEAGDVGAFLSEKNIESTEKAVRFFSKNENQLRGLLDKIQVVAANRKLLNLLGVSNLDHLRKFLDNIGSQIEFDSLRPLKEHERTSDSYGWEVSVTDRRGDRHTLRFQARPAPVQDGEIQRIYVSIVDVTREKRTEDQLRQSEEALSHLIDSVPGIVYRCRLDREWTMMFISENVEELTGYEAEGFIENRERSYASVIHDDDREEVFNTVTEAVNEDEVFELEYRVIDKDGSVRWVLERGKPVRNEGEVDFLQGVIMEITDRKRIQDELRRSERRFREMTENMNTIFFMFAPNWEEMIYVNEYYEELWNRSSNRLRETPLDFLNGVHPEDRNNVEQAMTDISNGEERKIEFRVKRSDEDTVWVMARGVPIKDDEGIVKRIAGYVEEISRRKEYELKLRDREERFELLAKNVNGIFFVFSDRWENLEYNKPYFEDIFGINGNTLEDDPMSFLQGVHPDDREKVKNSIQKFFEGDEASLEYRVNPIENYSRWVWTHGFPVTGEDGEVHKVVGYTQDITNRKQTEQELELFHTLVDHSNDEFLIIDPETAEFIDANEQALENLGYDKDELLDMTVLDIEERFSNKSDWNERMKKYDANDSPGPVRGEHRRKDGSTYPVEVNSQIVEEKGKQYLVSVARDLTQREEMQQELLEKERRLRSLVKAQPDLVFIFNRDGEYIDVLTEDHELLAAPPERLVGASFHDVFEDQLADRFLDHIQFVIDENKRDVLEYELTIDGETHCFEARSAPIQAENDDEPLAVFVARDITARKEIQNQLEESQQRFQEMAENIEDIFWLLDPHDDELLYISPAYEDIFGLPVDELLEDSTSFMSVVHPEDQDRVMQYMKDDQRLDLDVEHRIVVDGEVRWINTKTFPVTDENGNVVRIAGLTQDFTEKKRLRQEHEKFFNLTPDLFAIASMDGYYEDVNPAFEETLGYSRDELISSPFMEFVHPDDRAETERTFQQCQMGEEVTSFENRYITADGDYRWLSWRSVTENNKIYAVARDVTERKETEEQLAYQKSLLEAQQDAAIEGILVTSMDPDENSIILSYNQRFQEMWNIPDEVMETKSDEEALQVASEQLEDPDEFLQKVQYLYEHPHETSRDEIHFKDGRVFDRYTSPVESDGEIYGRVWFFRDVTEERQIKQELEQSLREKETLLREVHHRVKNNMQIISSLLRMQSRQESSEALKNAFQDSINRVKSMALIHEKLYESEQLSNLNVEGYLEELCDHLIHINAREGLKPDINMNVEIDDIDLQTAICCGLIINELVSNALEHAFPHKDEGRVSVELSQDQETVLKVSDNGIGLEEDFDPEELSSTGIRIVRSLAEYELGGSLAIEDDDGLTVKVRF